MGNEHDFLNDNLIAIMPVHDKYIGITWQVSDFCNFKCSYCNPGNWAGKNKNIANFEKMKLNLQKIFNYYQERGYHAFKFYFSGGEPTVWEHLIPLIEWLNETLDEPHIGINTNLSRSTKWWKEHYHLFHDIVASFHIEYANQDRYLKNLIYLQDKVNYLCSRMMMIEERFQEVIEYGEMVKSTLQNYNVEWVPLFDEIGVNAGPWEYSEQWMKDFFKENSFESQIKIRKPSGSKWRTASKEVYESGHERIMNGNRMVSERRNFFRGWKCNVGESLFVDSVGGITAASCGRGPKLGNMYRNVELQSESIICDKDQCTCGTDMIITKEKFKQVDIIAKENTNE